MSERERRLAENETLFREVNERLRELHADFSTASERAEFVCECTDPECTEHLSMTLEAYERVRSNSARFVVKSGHDDPTIERVVATLDGSSVVEKVEPVAAEIAAEQDPRS